MKIALVFSVLLAALTFANGRNPENLRILGGNDAIRNQFPYQVSVQVKTLLIAYTHKCGGVIYSPKYVLTAAQCTDGVSIDDLRIVAGVLKLTDDDIANQQTIGASQIIQHPNYPGGGIGTKAVDDISLIKLSSIFIFGSNVASIVVPKTAPNVASGIITGWGYKSTSTILNSNTLQYAHVKIINTSECASALTSVDSGYSLNGTANLCTLPPSTGSQAPYTGDIGGPLVVNQTILVGIISWGIKPVKSSNPYVYVNVTSYWDWIGKSATN